MALVRADRVRETTTTTGTGSISLLGQATGYRAFSSVMADGDTCYYCIVSQTGTEWETGLGTFSSPATLARTTVHSSSNSGSVVNFSAGTKDVFIGLTANQFNNFGTLTSVSGTGTVNGITLSGTVTSSGNLTLGGSLSNVSLASQVTGTLPVANGGTGASTLTGYVKGSGTTAFTASATIPGSDISGDISGNAANVTGVVAVANGGTGTSTGSITGTGALTFTAGGTNQNVTISPSGTGKVVINTVTVGTGGGSNPATTTILGYNALASNSGKQNTAVGYEALLTNTTGTQSTAIGNTALKSQTTGAFNSAVGQAALLLTTSGIDNTGIGAGSLANNLTGSGNVAIGTDAGAYQANGTASLDDPENSIYIGFEARGKDNADSNSIVIGYQAISKGANTTVLGNSSTTQTWLGGGELRLPGSTSGYVGLQGAAAAGSTTYTLPSADGTSGQVLSTNGTGTLSWTTVSSTVNLATQVTGTLAVGNGGTGATTLTGYVKGNGTSAFTASSTVAGSDVSGNITGNAANVTGTVAIANGGTGQTTAANAINALLPSQTSQSGKYLTTNGTAASWATVSASPAGSSGQVQYNSSGSFAGASRLTIQSSGWPNISDSQLNTGIGNTVLNSINSSAEYNTAYGYATLNALTSGDGNGAFGYGALKNATTGYSNNAFGLNSLFNTATGFLNSGFGHNSGFYNTSSYNTFVGYNSNVPEGHSGNNNTCIGYSAISSSTTAADEITLGNSSVATLRCQVTTITSLSDARDKTNITPMPSVLSFIASLNPVRFDWWMRDGAKVGVPDYGFIAQELQQAQNSTGFDWAQLVYESNPEKLEASPGKLIPILVKAIQELAAEVAELKAR